MALETIKPEFSSKYLLFGDWEREVSGVVQEKFPGLPLFFENLFGFYYKTFEDFSEVEDWFQYPSWKRNCFLFYTKALRTIYAAHDLSYKGYYLESLATTRIIYETFLRIAFLVQFPEKEDRVFDINTFKIRNAEKELGIDLYDTYKILSNFTHSHKSETTLDLYTLLQGQTDSTAVRPVYNEDFFLVTFNILLFFLWALVAVLPEVFPSFQSVLTWKTEQKFLMDECGRWFSSHPKEKWRKDFAEILLLKEKMNKN